MADHDRRPTAARDPRPAARDPRPAVRDPRARLDDHASIGRLADELLPSLIARLGATGLGEIEVREGDWRVRLRRPTDGTARHDRRATDRPSRTQPGHAGHGHAPAAVEGHRAAGARASLTAVGPGAAGGDAPGGGAEAAARHRAVATSPAVGIFRARPGASAGTKVRAGDRLAVVEMLGVPHDVVAPVDGNVGASLVEPGEAVEYGQELIRIELASTPAPTPDGGGAADSPGSPDAPFGAGEA